MGFRGRVANCLIVVNVSPAVQIVNKLTVLVSGVLQATAPVRQRIAAFLAKHRRKVAIGVSLGLHGMVLVFFLIGVSSEISGGGNHGDNFGAATGSGLIVEMVSVRDVMPDALKIKQPDAADAAEPTDFTTSEITQAATEAAMLITPSQPSVQLASEAMPDSLAGGAGAGGQSAGVNDPLWQQIEPCWKRLANHGTRGAMLRVSFSPLGNIAKTGEAPNAPVSDAKAETVANRALAECGPYVAAGSREDVVIAFPAL